VYEIEPIQYYQHVNVKQENAPWGLARLSSTGPVPGPDFVYTYRTEASGAGVTAYIIDTGINDKHVDFENRARKGPTFVQDDPTSSNNDVYGHGTHVAGTIGGKIYGVAKNVDLVGVKVFNDETGTASTIDIIKALQWVVEQVPSGKPPKAVVNLSLGGGASPAMDAAIAATVRHGVVVVVAAGNDNGNDLCFFFSISC
jgi:subtilisin family serine protease